MWSTFNVRSSVMKTVLHRLTRCRPFSARNTSVSQPRALRMSTSRVSVPSTLSTRRARGISCFIHRVSMSSFIQGGPFFTSGHHFSIWYARSLAVSETGSLSRKKKAIDNPVPRKATPIRAFQTLRSVCLFISRRPNVGQQHGQHGPYRFKILGRPFCQHVTVRGGVPNATSRAKVERAAREVLTPKESYARVGD